MQTIIFHTLFEHPHWQTLACNRSVAQNVWTKALFLEGVLYVVSWVFAPFFRLQVYTFAEIMPYNTCSDDIMGRNRVEMGSVWIVFSQFCLHQMLSLWWQRTTKLISWQGFRFMYTWTILRSVIVNGLAVKLVERDCSILGLSQDRCLLAIDVFFSQQTE